MAINPQTFAQSPKNWRTFKLWVTVIPLPTTTDPEPPRLTIYREMGRLAIKAYQGLGSNALIKLPQHPSSATASGGSLISGLEGSFSYTPQIGNKEPYLFVMGHFFSTRDIKNPFSTKPVISGNRLYNIPTGYPSLTAPSVAVLDDVRDLKNLIDSEMTTALPTSVQYNIDKLDYLGIMFGAGGYHFPQ